MNGSARSRTLLRQKDEMYDFLCECSDPMCAERVVMTSAEYEYVRPDPTRFVVAKGHVLPEVESVVDRAKDHVVVEKEGEAADIAIRLGSVHPLTSGFVGPRNRYTLLSTKTLFSN